MPNPRVATCIFCDDIREEVGGKRSLMGCYGGDMNISVMTNEFGEINYPVVLHSFGIHITITSDLDDRLERLGIRVEGTDGKNIVNSDNIEIPHLPANQNREDSTRTMLVTSFKVIPLLVTKPGFLSVYVNTDRGEIRAGRLQIQITPISNSEASPTS